MTRNISHKRVIAIAITWLSLASSALGAPVQCPTYAADDEHLDCHFEGDEERVFIVDDRGGQGVGFDFQIRIGDISANHSFCPHCSLAIFTLDPGIDVPALTIAGFDWPAIQNLSELDDFLQDLLDTQPEELLPELSGEDLEAFVASVMATKAKVSALIPKVKKIIQLVEAGAGFEWPDTDFEPFADEIGAKHDSAFRADFDNPNDPKKLNSGARVFGLVELVQAMADANVPEAVQSAVQTLLSVIPGFVDGTFELSGDDDNPLDPVSYHGIHTGMTVRHRSYTVTGNNATLLVFTVVNSTTRIIPLLQVGLLSDFDIPPLSKDKETGFEPASQTVWVYDEHPYADPPVHFAYGSAPVLGVVLDPSVGPIFANYNLDKNLSLTQFAGSIETKRRKYFLWHPDVSGDHDDAVGKSEKQGAVSVMFPGAILPKQQRTAAFCYAQGHGGSKAAAMADLFARLEACKGLYALLTPSCGNGTLEFGEACDDANTDEGDGCSAECEVEVCGDSRVVGAEECDDGNTRSDDGCSATCATEFCGDGIVQTGEQCDDGNESNSDSCLNSCVSARCGDGFVLACNPELGVDCDSPCASGMYCLSGTFTLDTIPAVVNQNPASGVLLPLLDVPVTFAFGFDIESETIMPGDGGFLPEDLRQIHTGPASVRFEGNEWAQTVLEPLFQGTKFDIELSAIGGQPGSTQIRSVGLYGPPPSLVEVGGEFFTIELSGKATGLPVDADGIPELGPGEWSGLFLLRRFSKKAETNQMTDYSSGAVAGAIATNEGSDTFEQCDDGNLNSFDTCTVACRWSTCGDYLIHYDFGEQCDAGPAGDELCTPNCQLVNIVECGDGDVDEGEQCDDGGLAAGDGCSPVCQDEFCGDGILQAPEQCDDGNQTSDDGCDADCTLEYCGDGIAQVSESCDTGAAEDDGVCLTSCVQASCGDGFLLAGEEECDDANDIPGDGCTADCRIEFCGDGLPGPDEECDDGNDVASDGCTSLCRVEICGDALPGPDEQCDDGNLVSGDGCSKDCVLEFPDACGNGAVGPGEECDDGGVDDGDGCNALCQLENPAACGDGTVDPGEQCDDGNLVAGDGCAPSCATEKCGDNIQQPGEQCDDGNVATGDGCDSQCQLEPKECGDGIQQPGEQCDDGNLDAGDGCGADCQSEPGSEISVLQTCGNGVLEPGEQCDDGGHWEGDGCDELCQFEASVCGNGAIEYGEACDDANTTPGDGCDATCQLEGVCSNGTVELGEACDDGNTDPGDGCNSVCKVEFCGNYITENSPANPEECDDGDYNSDSEPNACRRDCRLPYCGDGVVDDGECDGATPCLADCAVTEPEPTGGGCGYCVQSGRHQGGGDRSGAAPWALSALALLGWSTLRRRAART